MDKTSDEDYSYQYSGLKDYEIKERILEGKANILPKSPSRTVGEIIKANLFTAYNGINMILAVFAIVAGSPKNALFAGVIVTNTLIGIVQEIRAKKVIENLSVVNAIKVPVMRDGKEAIIGIEEIVLDDIVILKPGMQIAADSIVLEGSEVEMDESLLTGETDICIKNTGDKLLSGSFVMRGLGYARVTEVGSKTYAAKLSNEAKKFKLINSELQSSINKILKLIIYIIIPIGILLVITQIKYNNKSWQDAVLSSIAGIIGMIPGGFVLLISLTFLVSVMRLSKLNTLVQELPATEVLARVDTLCLDKTGTITDGKLRAVDIVPLNNVDINYISDILSYICNALPVNNSTQEAINKIYKNPNPKKAIKKIPFSSSRKWSGVEFKDEGAWVLGAPEVILNKKYGTIKSMVDEQALMGRRVLLLAKVNGELKEDLTEDIESLALILIEETIRKDATKTLKYFNDQGVNIKIISGDNPITVSAIAKRAGVNNAEKYIDARKIQNKQCDLSRLLEDYTVFGRVTPKQKKEFVRVLQSTGHTVAMTGDGVNDVLALKESDCGIAMASGSDAAKAVAQLILLDSSFSSLPKVVDEGRRIINNLERVSILFLSKTVYSILLSTIFCLILKPYPILPIQLTFIGNILIGTPSFFLAMVPNNALVKEGFLTRVLNYVIPNGIFISLSTVTIFLVGLHNGLYIEQCRTLSLIVIGGMSLILVLRTSKPICSFTIAIDTLVILSFMLVLYIPFTRRLLSLTYVDPLYILLSILLIILSSLASKFSSEFLIKRRVEFAK